MSPRMRKSTWSLVVAGFAVSLGLTVAIAFSADWTLISLLGSSDETHDDSEMMAGVNAALGLRRPLELLVPTVLGIIALVKAIESLRVEGSSTTAVMAIVLAISGPFIAIAVFLGFFMYGVNMVMLTEGDL